VLKAILNISSDESIPALVGMLPDADHPREIEKVTQLAQQRWSSAEDHKEIFFERLLNHLHKLTP
jgi:hypothetical protein